MNFQLSIKRQILCLSSTGEETSTAYDHCSHGESRNCVFPTE